jgi:hypothetical protein
MMLSLVIHKHDPIQHYALRVIQPNTRLPHQGEYAAEFLVRLARRLDFDPVGDQAPAYSQYQLVQRQMSESEVSAGLTQEPQYAIHRQHPVDWRLQGSKRAEDDQSEKVTARP